MSSSPKQNILYTLEAFCNDYSGKDYWGPVRITMDVVTDVDNIRSLEVIKFEAIQENDLLTMIRGSSGSYRTDYKKMDETSLSSKISHKLNDEKYKRNN